MPTSPVGLADGRVSPAFGQSNRPSVRVADRPSELSRKSGERRRRWTTEQKQTIAAQSLAPGVSPTDVARLHGISTGQLYTWRHALKAVQPGAAIGRFARVEVAPRPLAPVDVPARPSGLIEIALSDGTMVRVDAGIDPRALRRVMAALRG
jgi:transposase